VFSLFDYMVRFVDLKSGTTEKIRVLVESGDHDSKWGTVGVSEDIIEASWQALIDSILYKLTTHSQKKTEIASS
jgi:2-isopropylmalate synthase